MFRLFITLCAWFSLGLLQAQPVFMEYFETLESRVCPFDSNVQIEQPPNWFIYQTQNDHWDGPLDSTQCISAIFTENSIAIPAEAINPDKPVFIRSTLPEDDPARELVPNWHYLAENGTWPNNLTFDYDLNCPDGICTGLILLLALPNEAGDSILTRQEVLAYREGNESPYCFASENVPSLTLKELVIKVSLDDPGNGNGRIALRQLQLFPNYIESFGWVESLLFPWEAGPDISSDISSVVQPQGQTAFGSTWIIAHDGLSYPGAPPIRYVEAQVDPPTSEPKQLNIWLMDLETLMFQPYTAVRGALVEGSDSLRHQLNIYFTPFSNLCGFLTIDLMINTGTRFVFSGGEIDFANNTSCMMVANGGEIQVNNRGHLKYGPDGVGLLGLFNRGTLRLEQHTTLEVNTRVSLLGQGPNEHGYADLQPGSRLIFGEGSALDRQYPNSGMRLRVLMNGGTLDDSRLTADERALIERIYPHELPKPVFGSVAVFPNPARTYLQLALNSRFPNGPAHWAITDVNGRTVAEGQLEWSAYDGSVTLPALSLPRGTYHIRVTHDQSVAQGSIVWLGE